MNPPQNRRTAPLDEAMSTKPSSKPMLLLVATLCIMLLALVSFWLAYLPNRLRTQLAASFANDHGLVLDGTAQAISFSDGLSFTMEGVSLSAKDDDGPALTAQKLVVKTGYASLLGVGAPSGDMTLYSPLMTFDIGKGSTLPKYDMSKVTIRDGSLRIRDNSMGSVITIGDVNGTIAPTSEGGLKLNASFLQGNDIWTIDADLDDMARLLEPGSPGDITLSGKEMIAVFSGRVKAGDGLALDGQLNVQVNQSSTLTSWFSLPAGFMTDTAVLNLASGISSNGLAFDLPTLEAKFGSSVVKGKARLEAGLDRPKVSAELSTDMLSIFPRASQLLAKPWSEAAISTQALNAFDADIKIKADHLQMRGSDFVGGTVETNLANGGLTVNAKLAGPMDFALGLKPVEQSYLLNLKMSAENVDAAGVLNGWFGLSAITGTLTADATFTSNGKSFAELVSTLKGSLSTSLKEGRVDGADLTIFVQSATQGWPPGNTKALTFNQKGIVEEGVLKLSDASLNVAGSSFKPKGEIDFLRQAFDLQLTNKLSLTGPWTKPSTVPPLGPAPALRSPSEEPAAISPPGN